MTSNTTRKKEIGQQLHVTNHQTNLGEQKIQIGGDYPQEDLLLLAKAWEIIEPQS